MWRRQVSNRRFRSVKNVKINCNVVLKDIIEKAEQAGGDTFYRYNAVTATCQRFINVLMKCNLLRIQD